MECDLNLTTRNLVRDNAALAEYRLGANRVANCQLRQHDFIEVFTAGATRRIHVSDGLGLHQRALQALFRGEIRQLGPRLDSHADTDSTKVKP